MVETAAIDGQESDDPIVPREVWRPIVANLFRRLVEEDPQTYDLGKIQKQQPQYYRKIIEQRSTLEALGDAPVSQIENVYRRLFALFKQAEKLRQGYRPEELALDENGEVVATLITDQNATGRQQLLGGCWATWSDDFVSPDGRPVLRLDEIESMLQKTAAEIKEIVDSKRQ